MARPITRKVKLREGFYIEIFRSPDDKGIKIRRETYDAIQNAMHRYRDWYKCVYLGELVNGEFVKKG